MDETMNIPTPAANYHDRVMVKNYRTKDNRWEEGKVVSLNYSNTWGKFRWSYDVVLDRCGPSGGGIRLYVGCDKIKPVN